MYRYLLSMKRLVYFILFFIVVASACTKVKEPNITAVGMKPVYVVEKEFYDIKNGPQQSVKNTGTIYIWQQYFMIIEYRKGIHVYDRTNPALPLYITFLHIPGCNDFTISDSTLFVDNGFDILSINIKNINAIKVNKVLKNATKNSRDMPPTNFKGYFECYDPSKGYYIGWDSTQLVNPHCKTNS